MTPLRRKLLWRVLWQAGKLVSLIALGLLLLYLIAIGDDTRRDIKGEYQLLDAYKIENYYLCKRSDNGFSAPVIRIGWNHRYIVAEREKFFFGENGWTVIDLNSGTVREPLSYDQFRAIAEVQGIPLHPPTEAWGTLKRANWFH